MIINIGKKGGCMDCCNGNVSMLKRCRQMFCKAKGTNKEKELETMKVVLVGNPNVGKSVIFNSLTGAYVTVSNYPGTTVEVSTGHYISGNTKVEVVDTPGMYSMLPITEEERVTRSLLLEDRPDLVIHVIDAKNIERMLPLTLQLIETGYNVALVLNIMDEAQSLGVKIDFEKLQDLIGIPVVFSSAALNRGLSDIKGIIEEKIKDAA